MTSTIRDLIESPSRRVVVFDWYDGPREGVFVLHASGTDFTFELLDERPREDDVDDRLFVIKELPRGSVDALVEELRCFGEPTGVVWTPRWTCPSPAAIQRADEAVERLLAMSRPTSIIVRSDDMVHFSGAWQVPQLDVEGNWFDRLGL